MAPSRLATFAVNGTTKYGAVVDNGVVDLSARHARDFPTLRDAIAANALEHLVDSAAGPAPDHALADITITPEGDNQP